MPFTYFAHQVPVLPLKARWPDRWDGLGLVVGSIVPDLHYVTSGWVFGPFGLPLWSDGHRLDLIVQNCVLPGLVLTLLLRRAVPTVAPVLPDLGPAHVRDLALVGRARHRWWVTALSVFVGALTHLLIDGVTHAPGMWPLQYAGHVVGTAVGVVMVVRLGRSRAMRRWHGVAVDAPEPVPDPGVVRRVRATLGLSAVLALAYGVHRLVDGAVPAFMAVSCVMLAGVLAAGAVGRRAGRSGAGDTRAGAVTSPG